MPKIGWIILLAIGINVIPFLAPTRGGDQNISLLDLTFLAVDEDPGRHWILNRTTKRAGTEYLEQFNSALNEDRCWQLHSVNGQAPTPRQQAVYQSKRQAPITLAELRGAMVEGSLQQISDEGSRAIFSFRLGSEPERTGMHGKIYLNKRDLNIERVELRQQDELPKKGSV